VTSNTLYRARLAALISILVAVAGALRVSFGPEPNFVLRVPDDAFYYLGIARVYTARGVFSFDGGQTLTSGFHLLWMYLLLPIVRIAGTDNRLLLSLATGLSAAIALGVALVALVWFWRRASAGALFALAISLSSYAFLNGQSSVVEWPLCIASGAALFALLARHERTRGRSLLALFSVGLVGSLARSDFGGVALATCVAALLVRHFARRQAYVLPSLAALLGAMVGLGVVLLHQHWISGSWVQGSARVKAIWGAAAGWSPAPVLHQFSRAALYVPTLQNVTDRIGLKQRLGVHVEIGIVVVILLSVALLAWKRSRLVEIWRALVRAVAGDSSRPFLLLSSLLTGAFYVVFYSANPVGVQSWYTAHIWVPSFIVLALIIEAALGGGDRIRRRSLEAAFLAVAALNWTVFVLSPPVYAWQGEMRREGLLLAERMADGTLDGSIGWSDAGIVGFYQGGDVINLDGLVNDEIAAYLPDRLHCYLLTKHIRYLSSFGAAAEHFLQVPDPARFAHRITLKADDGYTIDLYEVDAQRLSRFRECRQP